MSEEPKQTWISKLLSPGRAWVVPGYGLLAAVGGLCAAFLVQKTMPDASLIAWLAVAFFSAWGLGVGVHNLLLRQQLRNFSLNLKLPFIWETWLLILVSLVELLAACWRLGGLTLYLSPVVALLVLAVPLAEDLGILGAIAWGAAAATPALLGWGSLTGSLFHSGDVPVWLISAFIFLWVCGSQLLLQASQQKMEGDHSAGMIFDWARICQTLSLAPLFFLGQKELFGLTYGIALFMILVLSESQHRSVQHKDPAWNIQRVAWVNLAVSLLFLVGCLMGNWLT